MSRLCVLCPKGYTFLYSTISMNRRFRGIFALLAGCILVPLCILPLTHLGNNVLECEHRGALKPRNVRLGRLMATLQNGRYINYGHLHFSSIDGRDKNVWLVAIITQMLVKSSDQALVCSGGNGLEKPLQAPILELLDPQLVASLLENSFFIAKVFSKMSFQLSMGSLATMARVPEDREVDPWPLGILKGGWGFLSNTWWATRNQRV
jgi:hypothetical protein